MGEAKEADVTQLLSRWSAGDRAVGQPADDRKVLPSAPDTSVHVKRRTKPSCSSVTSFGPGASRERIERDLRRRTTHPARAPGPRVAGRRTSQQGDSRAPRHQAIRPWSSTSHRFAASWAPGV